jgi:ribosome maturation factor RimP
VFVDFYFFKFEDVNLTLQDKISVAIKDQLINKGYDLVRINIISKPKMIVDISIDRTDGKSVSIDDCAIASNLISAIFDVEDIIKYKYNLNVSSPGEYRPLNSISDFERFLGHYVTVELFSPIDGRKKISGKLMKVEQNSNSTVVYLKERCDTDEAAVGIDYASIKKAGVKRIFEI